MKKKPSSARVQSRNQRSPGWFSVAEPSDRFALIAIVAVALLARIIYALNLQDSIFWGLNILDADAIDKWAKQIASGILSDGKPFYRAPLYGYLIGGLYAIFGASPLTVICFQTTLGLGIVYLTFVYARQLFDRRIALTAATIVALYPTLIFYESELMITTLEVFLGLGAVITIHRALEFHSNRSLVIAGLVLGLAAITRPTFLVLAPLLPIALYLAKKSSDMRPIMTASGIFLAGMIIPIVPVTLHNVIAGDDFVLISSQGGANFYLGNSAEADGITARQFAPTRGNSYYQDNVMSIETAESELGRSLKHSEASSYWSKRAFADIFDQPVRAIKLLLKKCYLFWHGQEIYNAKSLYFSGDYSWLMRITLWKYVVNFPSGVLFPLMILGIYLGVKEGRALTVPGGYLTAYMAAIALFFVCARFRQPIIPMAAIFAGAAVVRSLKLWKERNWSALRIPTAILLISGIALNWGGDIDSADNKSQYSTLLGNLYFSRRDIPKSIEYFEQALTVQPENTRACSQLGVAYAENGQFEMAVKTIQSGIERFPDYAGFHSNLGNTFARFGRPQEAVGSFKRAIELVPNSMEAHLGLAQVYEMLQLPDSARIEYEQVLRLYPNQPLAQQRLSALPRQK